MHIFPLDQALVNSTLNKYAMEGGFKNLEALIDLVAKKRIAAIVNADPGVKTHRKAQRDKKALTTTINTATAAQVVAISAPATTTTLPVTALDASALVASDSIQPIICFNQDLLVQVSRDLTSRVNVYNKLNVDSENLAIGSLVCPSMKSTIEDFTVGVVLSVTASRRGPLYKVEALGGDTVDVTSSQIYLLTLKSPLPVAITLTPGPVAFTPIAGLVPLQSPIADVSLNSSIQEELEVALRNIANNTHYYMSENIKKTLENGTLVCSNPNAPSDKIFTAGVVLGEAKDSSSRIRKYIVETVDGLINSISYAHMYELI